MKQLNCFELISEDSRDTEDWSNDAENSALHHRNKLHFTIYYNSEVTLKWNNINQINAALVSIRQKQSFKKNKLLNICVLYALTI